MKSLTQVLVFLCILSTANAFLSPSGPAFMLSKQRSSSSRPLIRAFTLASTASSDTADDLQDVTDYLMGRKTRSQVAEEERAEEARKEVGPDGAPLPQPN